MLPPKNLDICLGKKKILQFDVVTHQRRVATVYTSFVALYER